MQFFKKLNRTLLLNIDDLKKLNANTNTDQKV